MFVNQNALLTGGGTVGSTTVKDGGVLSPGGGAPGTLNVNSSLALQSGSLYIFGVTGGSAGLTKVSGTATIDPGASATALFQGSRFANQYTILSAANVIGAFSNFTTNSTAISATLITTTNSVVVKLTSNFTGGGTGSGGGNGGGGNGGGGNNGSGGNSGTSGPSNLTRNQFAVARALDNAFNIDGGSSLPGLIGAQLPAAFDALSGEGTSASQETAFGASRGFTAMMMQQGAFWKSGAGEDTNGMTYGATRTGYAEEKAEPAAFKAMPVKAQPFEARWRGWATGFDSASSLRGEASVGSADQSHRIAGAAGGIDYQINPDLLIGAALGGSTSDFSVPGRATSGSLEGAHAGAYGVARWNAWYAAGALALAGFDNKTSRSIVGVGPTESATGRFGSELLSGRFELGWTQTVRGIAITPFAAVEPASLWQRGYNETSIAGGTVGVNALAFASHRVSSLPTFLGAQVDTRFTDGNGVIWSPYARVSWVHEFEPTRDVTASFISLPGFGFTVDGPRAASDAARIDLGTQLALTHNTSLYGSFEGEFSDRSRTLAGKGGFKVSW